MHELNIAWTLNHISVDSVITGTSSLGHVKETIQAINVKVPTELLGKVDDAVRRMSSKPRLFRKAVWNMGIKTKMLLN